MEPDKKLKRSTRYKMLSGVCGGIAEYFNTDVTIIRLLWVAASFLSGFLPGLLFYLAAAFVIPQDMD